MSAESPFASLASGPRIDYFGSGLSHFQAEPLMTRPGFEPEALSDWEYELLRQLRRPSSRFSETALSGTFPNFLLHKHAYIRRSSELGQNMFRFSVDFSRLCPKAGEFDEQLMAEYIRTLILIKATGQEPFLTLHHYTMPRYLTEVDTNGSYHFGAWEHPQVLDHFRFYISSVMAFLSDRDKIAPILNEMNLAGLRERLLSGGLVQYFMTFNEPMVTPTAGYLAGLFPPYKSVDYLRAKRVVDMIVKAHGIATNEIRNGLRSQSQEPKVGLGHNWSYYEGLFGPILQGLEEHFARRFETSGPTDFLGVHYYNRTKTFPPDLCRKLDYSDQPKFGDIYPAGLPKVAARMQHQFPDKPLFVSEFGFSDEHDLRRPYWILETFRYILEAQKQGVPIKGVMIWTLVNNLEWDLGMSQKFGLFSESDLYSPLETSTKGIRSWEVWQAIIRAAVSPGPQELARLDTCYDRAKQQYENYINS